MVTNENDQSNIKDKNMSEIQNLSEPWNGHTRGEVETFLKNNLATADNLVEVTYSELVDLRNDGQLVPGRYYRITDYVTTTTQTETRSAGHQFDVIVRADSVNILNEDAWAIQHDGDVYFANSNLAAWKLKYCLDNDTTRFSWAGKKVMRIHQRGGDPDHIAVREEGADVGKKGLYFFAWSFDWGYAENGYVYTKDENPKIGDTVYDQDFSSDWVIDAITETQDFGKGTIYYMKDEFDNECSYDFKNIQFGRRRVEGFIYESDEEQRSSFFQDLFSNSQYEYLRYGFYCPVEDRVRGNNLELDTPSSPVGTDQFLAIVDYPADFGFGDYPPVYADLASTITYFYTFHNKNNNKDESLTFCTGNVVKNKGILGNNIFLGTAQYNTLISCEGNIIVASSTFNNMQNCKGNTFYACERNRLMYTSHTFCRSHFSINQIDYGDYLMFKSTAGTNVFKGADCNLFYYGVSQCYFGAGFNCNYLLDADMLDCRFLGQNTNLSIYPSEGGGTVLQGVSYDEVDPANGEFWGYDSNGDLVARNIMDTPTT